jgi:hypothetical protein
MADQNLSVDIKIKADTSGAKQAEKAIDGLTEAIEEQAVAEKELVQETEKVVVEEKKLVEVEKEATAAVVGVTHAFKDQEKVAEMLGAGLRKTSLATAELAKATTHAKEQAAQFVSANAYGKFDDTLLKAHDAMKKATVSANGVAQATKEVGKANSQGAMGFMALSNAVQDVQYGFGGIINNIPGIVSGMGLGMGVAGAAQIAGVAFAAVIKNVDLFGQKAEEAREKAGELAAEMMGAADKAYKEAASVEALAAARESQAAAMAKVDEAYKTTIALSDKAIKQAQEEKDAQTALIDAQSGMEMARIALAEAQGKMTKEEAIFAKDKARVEAESRKQTAQTLAEETKAAELRKKAAAEVETAEKKRQAAAGLAEGGVGLMNEAERKAARENIESMKAMQGVSQGRQEQLARAIDDKSLIDFDPEMTEKNRQANRKKLAQERDDYLATQAAIDKENAKLAADEAAKRRTGIASREELNKTVEAENKAADQGVARAGEFRGQATGTEAGIQRSNQLFNLRQAAGSMGALAQVEAERTKQREESEKERERAAKEAEKQAKLRSSNLKQVGTAGGSLASTLAGDGLAPGFADSLRTAAGGAGDAAGLDRLIAMVAKLTANSSKLSEQAKSKLDKLEAEIEDLRTAK